MREGHQQVFRVTFPGIRDSVRELLGVRMEQAFQFILHSHIDVFHGIYALAHPGVWEAKGALGICIEMKDLKLLQSVGSIEATDLSNGTIAVSL